MGCTIIKPPPPTVVTPDPDIVQGVTLSVSSNRKWLFVDKHPANDGRVYVAMDSITGVSVRKCANGDGAIYVWRHAPEATLVSIPMAVDTATGIARMLVLGYGGGKTAPPRFGKSSTTSNKRRSGDDPLHCYRCGKQFETAVDIAYHHEVEYHY